MPVLVHTAPLLILLLTYGLGKRTTQVRGPFIHLGGPEETPGSQLCTCPSLAVVVIWGNEPVDGGSISLSIFHFLCESAF